MGTLARSSTDAPKWRRAWKRKYLTPAFRQVRQESMKDLKRAMDDDLVSEDEEKVGEKKVQDLTDEMIAELDAIGARKEAELLQI